MSWTPLEPFAPLSAPRARAAIVVNKDRIPKLKISLSESLHKDVGSAATVDVLGGAGENAGKILLKFGSKGKFTLKLYGKGGAGMQCPIFGGVPDGAREAATCEVVSVSGKEVVLALPIASWEAQLAPVVPPKPRQIGGGLAPAPVTATNGATKPAAKVQIVRYLEGKGHEIKKLREGYIVDGQQKNKAGVLAIINEHRRKASIPVLAEGDCE